MTAVSLSEASARLKKGQEFLTGLTIGLGLPVIRSGKRLLLPPDSFDQLSRKVDEVNRAKSQAIPA